MAAVSSVCAGAENPKAHTTARPHGAAPRRSARLLWGRAVRGWDQGDHLALAVAGAGLDLAEIEAAVAADRSDYEAAVEANQAALEAAGHWGVPTLVFNGEPFFGQDRIDTCVWRMCQNGLTRR